MLRCLGILTCLSTILCSAAFAQTGPALMIKPWQEGQTVETAFQARWFEKGGVKDASGGMQIQTYDAQARWQVTGEEDHSLTIGFDMSSVLISGAPVFAGIPSLPSQLVDTSFAIGANIGSFDEWKTDVVLGLGYNGHDHFSDSEAWYAKASLIFTREIDDQSQFQFILDYNGNRSIFPDVPLPAIAYSRQVSDGFRYTAGLPFSSIYWQPADQWTIELIYAVPTTIDLEVAYTPVEHWQIFGAFRNRLDAYRLRDGDNDNRRVFFEQRLFEAGVRWQPSNSFNVELAGGYAFSQQFTRGFDSRDTNRLAKLSDRPFVSFKVDLNF